MKTNIFRLLLILAVVLFASCDDFLDRPTEDSYTTSGFYQNDSQLLQAINPIYNSPWHDFIRGFVRVGDCMSGNYYIDSDDFYMFTLVASNENLASMSAALWSANAYCNSVIENINLYSGSETTEFGRNKAKGEALVWKAMTYFFMVRIWGEVPIIHDNSSMIAGGSYNNLYKATTQNIYDYIVLTLEQAIEWLPETTEEGRLDKYCAYGLLAKVYLTKSGLGQNGSRNQSDLDKAAEYAKKVINESGRKLLPEYSDIFRLENNKSAESLIAWRWVVSDKWTSANQLQSEMALGGFDEYNCWGDWTGPSVDLQDAFGEDATKITRVNSDKRRKATMMMYGDSYNYFWTDKGGFNYSNFIESVHGEYRSSTGANCVKHLVGNDADHQKGAGIGCVQQQTNLATHLLRLADVYLVYAEAVLGNNTSTADASALSAYNAVRTRAGLEAKTTITFEDIWIERRLELAFEGDFWYDFVRLSYYDMNKAVTKLNAQRRKNHVGLSDFYLNGGTPSSDANGPLPRYNENAPAANGNLTTLPVIPFVDTDVLMNPYLNEPAVDHDINQYTY